MKYDFTSVIDRRGKDSLAVDIPVESDPFQDGTVLKEGFDKIPMWVADMNFATAPMIPHAMNHLVLKKLLRLRSACVTGGSLESMSENISANDGITATTITMRTPMATTRSTIG